MFSEEEMVHLGGNENRQKAASEEPSVDWWLSLRPSVHAGFSLADVSTLKMKAILSSEKSFHTRSTRRHIPEDDILHSHRHENLKSYIFFQILK
jgi:hypothetical protein